MAANEATNPSLTSSQVAPQQYMLAGGTAPLNAEAAAIWDQALAKARGQLASLLSDPNREALFADVFGRAGTDAATFAANLQVLLAALDGDGLRIAVDLRSDGELAGAFAAYAASGHTGSERIYVNADKLNNGLLDVNLATSALLEEFGHALDWRLNGDSDSPGDEGQLFAAEVSGVVLTAEQRALIDAEDDTAVLMIEGVEVWVELATFTATTGTDNPQLSTDTDTVTVTATNQIQAADTFSGGTGTDTIAIGAVGAGVSVVLSAAATNGSAGFLSFEAIQFLNTSGTSTATFAAEQFGSGKIELTSSFTGTASSQGVVINLAAAGSFDASGFTFSTWSSGTDSFSLNGSTGTETIGGSSQADSISGAAGNDTLSGGDGNDTIDGGTGNDRMSGGAGVDFFITSAAGGSSTVATSNSLAATISGSSVDNLIFDNGVDIITGFVVGTDILSGRNTQTLINLVGQSRTLDLTANRGYYAYGEWDGRRFLFRSNWASSRYNDLIFVVGDSGTLTPITSTGYTILTDISGSIDTIAPTITSFSTTTANGSYKAGDSINITATASEAILAGGQITVILNANTNPTVILTAATTGSTLTGTYTIAAGQNSADLTVTSFSIGTGAIGTSNATPRDAGFGNALTSTTVPSGTSNIAGSYAIVVDTAAPAAPTLALGTGVSNGATSAEATAVGGVVTISAENGASWSVQFSRSGGGTVTKTGTGTGSAQAVVLTSGDLTTLGNGSVSVSATATDAAGNASSTGTTSFTLDTAAPAAPTLALGTGVSNGATSAEATAVGGVVTISAENGASWSVQFSRSGGGTVTKTGTGTGSAQAVVLTSGDLTTLGNGSVSVSATATDAAGNASSAGTTSFTLDTVAPTLAITTPISTDGYVNNAEDESSLTISGTSSGADGRTVTVAVGSITAKTATIVAGGAWSISLTSAEVKTLTEGTINITANVSDTAGNPATQATAAFVYDTTAPTLAIASSTTALKAGETATITFTFSEAPTGFAAGDITTTGGALIGLAVTADPKIYTATFTPTASLASGSASITVAAGSYTDAAGNNGGAGTTPSISIDTLAPTVTISDNVAGTATGATTFTFTFSEAVTGFDADKITVGNGTKGTFTAVSSTEYTLVVTPTASSGGNITVDVSTTGVTDAAGNQATAPAQYTQAFDTLVPTVSITAIGGVDSIVSSLANDNRVVGTAEASRSVSLFFGATLLGSTTTDGSGNFSYALTGTNLTTIGQGSSQAITASQTDAAGNSGTSAPFSFSLDTVAPTLAIGTIAGDGIVSDSEKASPLTISGTTVGVADGRTVAVVVRDSQSTPTTVSLSGTVSAGIWTVTLSNTEMQSLAAGRVTVTANTSDAAGNAATPVSAFFTIDQLALTMSFTDTGSSNADGITNNGVFTVGNIATGFSWQHSTNSGATWSNGSATNAFTLLPGTYATGTVRVRQLDSSGIAGTPTTNQAPITVDVGAPTLAVTAAKSSLGLVGDAAETTTITFTFSEDPGATFSADDITVSAGTISAISGSGLIRTATYTPLIDFVGGATVRLASGRFTDLAGNINVDGGDSNNTISFSLNTLRASSAPQVSISSSSNRLKIGDTATLTFTFTQPPDGFALGDISSSSGSVSSLVATADSKVWRATYIPGLGVQALVAITVAAGSFGVSGNAGAGTNASASSLSLNVDTVAPASVLSVAFSADSGSSGSDLITNDPNQTVTGTVSGTLSSAVGFTDTVRVSIDNGAIWRLAEVTGETRTGFSLGNVTLGGPSTILVVVEDEAGNTSSTFSQNYVYDPITFTGELVLSGYGDNGQTGNVDSTIRQASGQDNSFTLTLPNKEVGASEVFQFSTNGGSAWTSTTAAQSGLADGTYRYRGTVTDTAGNTATSNVWSVVVDRTPPGVPTLSLAAGATGTDDPVTNQELTSGSGVLRISAEAGATLQLRFTSTATGSSAFTKSVVAGGGNQAVVLTSAETALLRGSASATGSYTVTVNAWAVDRAGNVGTSLSSPLTFTYSPDPITILGELRVNVLQGGSEAIEPIPSIFTISRTGDTTAAVTVTYRLSGSAIAGVDYTYPAGYNASTSTGTVTIAAGATSVGVSVPTLDNATQDGLRQIRLDLQPTSGYTLNSLKAYDVATLTDNDAPLVPVLSVANVSVVEGNSGSKTVSFIIGLSQATTVPVSFNYAFRAGTATMGPSTSSGSDFSSSGSSSGTLTFAATVTQINLSAVVYGDSAVETDETFFLDLSAGSGLTFLGGGSTLTATAAIVNDDSAVAVDPNQGVTVTSSGDFSGSERNDILTGGDGVNLINGLAGNDRITGGLAADQLNSGTGIDQFLYRSFAESSVAFGVDITDAAFTSGDRIGLPTRPSSLSNVGVITGAASLAQAFGLAQADIDPLTAGAQPLAPGQAVMFTYGSTTRSQRTYLGVADADTGSVTNDFLVQTPKAQFAIGSLDVQAFFL